MSKESLIEELQYEVAQDRTIYFNRYREPCSGELNRLHMLRTYPGRSRAPNKKKASEGRQQALQSFVDEPAIPRPPDLSDSDVLTKLKSELSEGRLPTCQEAKAISSSHPNGWWAESAVTCCASGVKLLGPNRCHRCCGPKAEARRTKLRRMRNDRSVPRPRREKEAKEKEVYGE